VRHKKKFLSALHEWNELWHDAFAQRSVWSLFNAFTESAQGRQPRRSSPNARRRCTACWTRTSGSPR